MTCPIIEALRRVFTNKAVQYTSNSDLGQWLRDMTTSTITSILLEVQKLATVDYRLALNNLVLVFEMIPLITKQKEQGTLSDDTKNQFLQVARGAKEHANRAFEMLEKTEDEIRVAKILLRYYG